MRSKQTSSFDVDQVDAPLEWVRAEIENDPQLEFSSCVSNDEKVLVVIARGETKRAIEEVLAKRGMSS